MGKFNLSDHIPAKQPQIRNIEVITTEILDAKRAGGEAILTIGKGLIEAKALLSHGEWLPWLEEKIEFSEKAAQNFMRLARHYSNPQTLADLGSSKALMLLAVPEEVREEFISVPHEVGGQEKSVADMSARELAQAIKERDEALKAAELAKAERKAADEARKKMSTDMNLANERIAELNNQVEQYSAEAREAQNASTRLEQELKELKDRPEELAVEADPAAIEAARKEAEASFRDKLDKAEDAHKKAKADLMELNSVLQRAKLEREQMEVELRKQLAQAEIRAALSSSEDLVLFRALFDQAQELVNRMNGVLLKVRPKDPEKARGLEKALLALVGKIQEVAAQ